MAGTTQIVSSVNTNSLLELVSRGRWCSNNRWTTHWCVSLILSFSLTNKTVGPLWCIWLFERCVYVQCPRQLPFVILENTLLLCVFMYVCVCVCLHGPKQCTKGTITIPDLGSLVRALSCAPHIPLITTILSSDTFCSTKHTYQLSAQQSESHCLKTIGNSDRLSWAMRGN